MYYPDAAEDVDKLKEACDASYHCIGFNTKGHLKKQIRDPSRWSKSSYDLYVRGMLSYLADMWDVVTVIDLDYCSLNAIGCSKGKKCRKIAAGKYGC